MRSLVIALLESSAMASIVILIVTGLRAVLGRKLPPVIMLALWALALVRLLLPVALPSPVHVDSLFPRFAATAAASARPAVATTSLDGPQNLAIHPVAAPQRRSSPEATTGFASASASPTMPQSLPDPWAAGMAVWILGAVVTLLVALARGRKLHGLVRLCQPVRNAALMRTVDALRHELGIRKPVRVLRCGWACAPMVYGILWPTLLLPTAYMHMKGDALRGVLLHELAHIQKHDLLKDVLWLAALAAHWFNPLAHLAHRLYGDDVELARDALVSSRLGEPARLLYGETLLNAARAQRHPGSPIPAAALLGGSSIGRRVRSVLAPRQHSRLGAAACAVLALVMVVGCFTTACQPTPTQSIVKQKSLDKMIQEATQTQSPGEVQTGASGTAQPHSTQVAKGEPLAQRMGVPATYQKELVDATGKVRIHINAIVSMPDAVGVAVQRVEQAKLSQEQIDVLVKCLMKGDLFSGNGYRMTKSEIQTQILQIQAAQTKIANGSAPTPKDKSGFAMQARLSQLQEDLKTAPEQSARTPVTSKLMPMDADTGDGEELYALAQPTPDVFQSFHAYNYSDGTSFLRFSAEKNAFFQGLAYFATKESIEAMLNQGLHGLMTQEEFSAIPDIRISKEDAKKTADDIVAALGIDDLVCISEDKEYGGSSDRTADQSAYVNPRRCVWYLRYARSVNGVPVTYTVYDCMKTEGDQQSAPWSYEDMTFAIDDSGVVYFDWSSPYNVTDTVTENSNVLSFGDAAQRFDAMALAQNAWDGLVAGTTANITGFDINVTRIVFGLTRVTEQNKRNSGLLVPCWDFFADTTYTEDVNGQTVTRNYDTGYPLLTVNAIDGTVINRSLGY